jgi:hypothetical protein
MDHTGREKKFFQFDGNKKPLFSLPVRIASNSRNNIGVIDKLSKNASCDWEVWSLAPCKVALTRLYVISAATVTSAT